MVICGFTLLFLFDKSDSLLLLLLVVGCWLEIVICGWVGEHWMIRLLFVGGADFG